MLIVRDMKHFMLAAGLGASLLWGAAAPVLAASFSTNGGSYSFEFGQNGSGQSGCPGSTNAPTASYASTQRPDVWQQGTSAATRPHQAAISTNGGTYYFEH